ncbi:hypothetical protein RZS08_23045, partial [Arthrospira platensis SPKY1]|nr:hypothetical protein [Arthrospira platensis SPKY1]
FEQALANMRELAEMVSKSNTEAFAIINIPISKVCRNSRAWLRPSKATFALPVRRTGHAEELPCWPVRPFLRITADVGDAPSLK